MLLPPGKETDAERKTEETRQESLGRTGFEMFNDKKRNGQISSRKVLSSI